MKDSSQLTSHSSLGKRLAIGLKKSRRKCFNESLYFHHLDHSLLEMQATCAQSARLRNSTFIHSLP